MKFGYELESPIHQVMTRELAPSLPKNCRHKRFKTHQVLDTEVQVHGDGGDVGPEREVAPVQRQLHVTIVGGRSAAKKSQKAEPTPQKWAGEWQNPATPDGRLTRVPLRSPHSLFHKWIA